MNIAEEYWRGISKRNIKKEYWRGILKRIEEENMYRTKGMLKFKIKEEFTH